MGVKCQVNYILKKIPKYYSFNQGKPHGIIIHILIIPNNYSLNYGKPNGVIAYILRIS